MAWCFAESNVARNYGAIHLFLEKLPNVASDLLTEIRSFRRTSSAKHAFDVERRNECGSHTTHRATSPRGPSSAKYSQWSGMSTAVPATRAFNVSKQETAAIDQDCNQTRRASCRAESGGALHDARGYEPISAPVRSICRDKLHAKSTSVEIMKGPQSETVLLRSTLHK